MTIMIVYASIEGQTAKIANFAAECATKAGFTVASHDVSDRMAEVPFDGADKVILAAPVHERRHPEGFEVFLNASSDALEARPTLLLSVSLNAAFADGLEEAQDYVTEMTMRTGFKPDDTVLVAGAVKSGSYDYFATQVVRHVLLADRPYDPSDGDREFTDWDTLAARIGAFLMD